MGDPRRTRKKYENPRHPWIAARIEEERGLRKEFGTRNKREIYRMMSALKRFKDQAKTLSSRVDDQAYREQEQMIAKMSSLGLIPKGATLDDILSLTINDLMRRRLQTVMVEKLLARSTKQARQFISHGHVLVDGKVVTSPSYLVKVSETLSFHPGSAFDNEQHPERFSEDELRRREEREREKQAQKAREDSDEAPPAYSEEELEDPEEATSKEKAEAAERAAKKAAKKAVKKASVKKAAAKKSAASKTPAAKDDDSSDESEDADSEVKE